MTHTHQTIEFRLDARLLFHLTYGCINKLFVCKIWSTKKLNTNKLVNVFQFMKWQSHLPGSTYPPAWNGCEKKKKTIFNYFCSKQCIHPSTTRWFWNILCKCWLWLNTNPAISKSPELLHAFLILSISDLCHSQRDHQRRSSYANIAECLPSNRWATICTSSQSRASHDENQILAIEIKKTFL